MSLLMMPDNTMFYKSPNKIYGYKAFKSDWTCHNIQYYCPGEFQSMHFVKLCRHGMHFCRRLDDVFKYYGPDLNQIHIAEVEAFGDVEEGPDKCCTNGLRIIRELDANEILWKLEDRSEARYIAWRSGIHNKFTYFSQQFQSP